MEEEEERKGEENLAAPTIPRKKQTILSKSPIPPITLDPQETKTEPLKHTSLSMDTRQKPCSIQAPWETISFQENSSLPSRSPPKTSIPLSHSKWQLKDHAQPL